MCKVSECCPAQRSHAIDTWLLILVPFTLPSSIQNTKSQTVEVHQNYSPDPRVYFCKTFRFLATDGTKMAHTANSRGDRLHSVAPSALLSLLCSQEIPCAKSPAGTELYGQSIWGKSWVVSLGSAFFLSKLLHRLICILNKRKITTRSQDNTDIWIFLLIYAVFISTRD